MRFLKIFFALLCLSCVCVSAPQPAHAGWLEFFFPELRKKEPNPFETMTAPFADPNAVIDPTEDKSGLGENNVPLNLRHRSNAIITKWVENTIADMLVYDADKFDTQYKEKAVYFNTTGLTEYVKFLQSENVVSSLRSKTYNLRSFIQDTPIIINEGDVDGRYRWLYKVKVMLSFVKVGLTSYKDAAPSDQITKEYTLTVHIGRTDKFKKDKTKKHEHGLLIEGWGGSTVVVEEETEQ